MAGNLSVETCGEVFAYASRQASSNYGVGSDGRIGCYLPEEYHPWTSSSYWNDDRAITIEVANTTKGCSDGTWAVSDAALESTIELCADICARYGFLLEFTGDSDGTLTRHNFYAATNCPGPYIEKMTDYIVEHVNALVRGDEMILSTEDIEKIAERAMIKTWEYIYRQGQADEDKTLQENGYPEKWSNRYNMLDAAFLEAHRANEKADKIIALIEGGASSECLLSKLIN